MLGGGGDLLATSDSLTSYLIGGSGGGAGSARSSAHPARTRMEAAGAAASEGGAAGGAAAAGGRGLSPLGRPSRDEAGVQAQAQADAASRRLSNAARMGAAGLHQGGPVQAVLAEARRESMSKGGGPRSSSIDMGNAVGGLCQLGLPCWAWGAEALTWATRWVVLGGRGCGGWPGWQGLFAWLGWFAGLVWCPALLWALRWRAWGPAAPA